MALGEFILALVSWVSLLLARVGWSWVPVPITTTAIASTSVVIIVIMIVAVTTIRTIRISPSHTLLAWLEDLIKERTNHRHLSLRHMLVMVLVDPNLSTDLASRRSRGATK